MRKDCTKVRLKRKGEKMQSAESIAHSVSES